MKKTRFFAFLALLAFALLVAGCVQTEGAQNAQDGQSSPFASASASASSIPSFSPSATVTAIATASADGAGGVVDGAETAGDETAGEGGLQFEDWTAPDGSITLQKPVGWTAVESQVDACTINWAVTNPGKTSEVFANNQILIFKSEAARQMYEQYGLTGAAIAAAPVSSYLNAEQAIAQIVAPLSDSSGFEVVARDAEASQQFSQEACFAGLAACDAQAFEAGFSHGGVAMRGAYFAQSFDLGDGGTWWINLWGYASPAAEWNASRGTLEKTFASVKYTDSWGKKCGSNADDATGIIRDVVKTRQAASEKAAQEWDEYIHG